LIKELETIKEELKKGKRVLPRIEARLSEIKNAKKKLTARYFC